MINIKDKTKCSGCGACYSICPQHCITMTPDFEGFLYPTVDTNKCIDCHLCENVCPVNSKYNSRKSENGIKNGYAIRTNDKNTLSKSTSGGFFFPILQYAFEHTGVICAAGFTDKFVVEHMIIDSANQKDIDVKILEKCIGSKYVQSNINECFIQIKNYLKKNRIVFFIGTPCQVAGLKRYLTGTNTKNLITIDLVCHGTPSPKLWEQYILYQEQKHHSKINNVSFRSKVYGYHSGGMMHLCFVNGKQYIASARVDYMLKSFFSEIASRPICYHCPFKKVERESDISIYDCWHFASLSKNRDDDLGYTNVLTHTEEGEHLLRELSKKIKIYNIDAMKAIELDGDMVCNYAKPHPRRDEFYKMLEHNTLESTIQSLIPVTNKDYLLENIKHLLYRLQVLKIIRRIKKGY